MGIGIQLSGFVVTVGGAAAILYLLFRSRSTKTLLLGVAALSANAILLGIFIETLP